MNEPREIDDPQLLIERLATGTLEGPVRRELFRWLENDPARWRQCALTLLECRELEQALGEWRSEVPASPANARRRFPAAPSKARRDSGRRMALVAGLMIAFCLGVFARGLRPVRDSEVVRAPNPSQVAAHLNSSEFPGRTLANEITDFPVPATERVRVQDVARARSAIEASESLPPYVRSQLEKHGYRVDSRHALVAVALPNGRSVKIPVDQLQFSYVGQRSY